MPKKKLNKKIIVSLNEQDYKKLSDLSEKERLSMSAIVRFFIVRRLYPEIK